MAQVRIMLRYNSKQGPLKLNMAKVLDLTEYRCPVPLVQAKLAIKQLQEGDRLHLLLSDPGSRKDVPAYFKKHQHSVEELCNDADALSIIITK